MRLLTATAPSSFKLVLLGDLHIGSNGCCIEGLKRLLNRIKKDKSTYYVNMGDSVEAICSDDKRFHYVKGAEALPIQQCAMAVDLFRPVASKCWAWLKGNHEDKLHRFGDIANDLIARPLGVPYGGYVCKLSMSDKFGHLFKAYLWHGPLRGSVASNAKCYVQQQANMKASVRRYLESKASDCAVMAMGHTHKLLLAEPSPKLLMTDDTKQLKASYLQPPEPGESYLEPDRRWYINTGSYLKSQILGDDSYAELAGYDPVEIGHIEITVQDRKITAVQRVVV